MDLLHPVSLMLLLKGNEIGAKQLLEDLNISQMTQLQRCDATCPRGIHSVQLA
jgi:hypothetical protein